MNISNSTYNFLIVIKYKIDLSSLFLGTYVIIQF